MTATPGSSLATGRRRTGPVTSHQLLSSVRRDSGRSSRGAVDAERALRGGRRRPRASTSRSPPAARSPLVGRNGAGKSTTMRVLAGVVPPTAGTRHRGRPSTSGPRPLTVKQLTGYCPDVGGLVPRATPWEHLQLSARLRRLTGWEDRARDLLERFELGDVMNRVTGGFSHGMGRRLSVVLAAMHEPQVLLLDEPFDGVDPIGVEATFDVIADAPGARRRVLLSRPTCATSPSRPAAPSLVMRGGARASPRSTAGRWRARRGHVPTAPPRPDPHGVARPRARHAPRPPAAPCRTSRSSSASARRPVTTGAHLVAPRSCRLAMLPRSSPARPFTPGEPGQVVRHLPARCRRPWPASWSSTIAVGGRLRRRPRAALPRPGVAVPDQPDDRPPRRPARVAPLNIAWMIQAWVAARVDVVVRSAPAGPVSAPGVMLLWLVCSTAVGQVVAGRWRSVRTPRPSVRGIAVAPRSRGVRSSARRAGVDQLTRRSPGQLGRIPTTGSSGRLGRWLAALAGAVVVALAGRAPGSSRRWPDRAGPRQRRGGCRATSAAGPPRPRRGRLGPRPRHRSGGPGARSDAARRARPRSSARAWSRSSATCRGRR